MVVRFLGRQVKRVDAKGRVSIPAPFRAVLAQDGYDGLFLVRSPTHPAVDGGGHALLSAIEATLAGHDPFSFEHAALAATLLGQGDSPTLDGEGRMGVPDWLREATGISSDVLFVGMGHRFQIWAPERFADFEIEARATARRLLGVTSGREGTP